MPEILIRWSPLILAAAGLLAGMIIAIRYKIPWLTGRVGKLEKVSHKQEVFKVDMADTVKKRELYKDGKPLYQHAEDCVKVQGSVCKKIDELKQTMKDLSAANQASSTELTKVMTRVEDFIVMDRTQELKTFAKIVVKEMSATKL